MNISKAKQQAMLDAERGFWQSERDRWNDMVFDLAMSLGLQSETVANWLDENGRGH